MALFSLKSYSGEGDYFANSGKNATLRFSPLGQKKKSVNNTEPLWSLKYVLGAEKKELKSLKKKKKVKYQSNK